MPVDNLPRASHVGELPIVGVRVPCAVLEDGRRVLTQEGYLEAIGRAKKAKGNQGSTADVVPFLAARNLQPYVSDELRQALKPIVFRHVMGGKAYGYPADTLVQVCDVFIAAENAGVLVPSQHKVAGQCHALKDALAKTGIVALVDEATGFQFHRAKDALEKIFDAYISKDLRKWTKMFPDRFYKGLFRMRGLTYNEATSRRPSYLAHDTNNFVYERLAPDILERLKAITPKDAKGRRRHKLHQRLSEDVGDPALREHLAVVMAFMDSSDDREDFLRRLDRVKPKLTTQPLLAGLEDAGLST